MTRRLRIDVPLPRLWHVRIDGTDRAAGAWAYPTEDRARVELRVRFPLRQGQVEATLRCEVVVPEGADVVVTLPVRELVSALTSA